MLLEGEPSDVLSWTNLLFGCRASRKIVCGSRSLLLLLRSWGSAENSRRLLEAMIARLFFPASIYLGVDGCRAGHRRSDSFLRILCLEVLATCSTNRWNRWLHITGRDPPPVLRGHIDNQTSSSLRRLRPIYIALHLFYPLSPVISRIYLLYCSYIRRAPSSRVPKLIRFCLFSHDGPASNRTEPPEKYLDISHIGSPGSVCFTDRTGTVAACGEGDCS
ncbi:hypothetical protein BZA05DRAFT_241088 [Tricharina praecox]|uniref:uncharacterized protein n=1 Tax=Tricharina praecox TaxID=43433 RepID=UPI002220D61B|nr:uncharacterized protein BZA05DRAFT_241088 [Tricharina praecox]KAI5855494.1 hypothetical protein BZA05DRAFT_241088 [Tricharina praecox]